MSTAITVMRPDLAEQWRQRKLEQLQNEWLKRVLYGEPTEQDRAAMAAIAHAAGIDPALLFAGTGEPGADPRTGPTSERAVYDPEVHVYASEDPAGWFPPVSEDDHRADEVGERPEDPEDTVEADPVDADVLSDLIELAHRNPGRARRLAALAHSRLPAEAPMTGEAVAPAGSPPPWLAQTTDSERTAA
ncbi:hypothetical protein CLV63_113190 [Murinocardiopsis flavida]|uniref:Uncharacterized protein n=1 Tax=Murinocardiopsis flavida TaxID=645275 RepID=A0A2P8DFR2_9ACTN|nr:hypothetical protein [Murinocardiopsis flavida]PSK96027.1 hypothetical protein CLV63_113190 [Murinocardiopsis flavida]